MRHIRISALLLALALTDAVTAQDANALLQQAVERQQADDYASAVNLFQSALKLQPNDVATHVNLGVALVKLGRFDEALSEYATADKLLPGDPRIALNVALAYEKSGRIQEAADRFEALHAQAPQLAQVTMLLADCRLQLRDDTKVIALLEPLQSSNPDDLGLAYMLGMALLHQHRVTEGQVLIDRILRNGDTPQARYLLGTRMFESGDYPAAVKELKLAADLDPHLPGLQSLYGQSLLNTGDPDGAAGSFRQALSTDPNDYSANLGLGQILTARKDFTQAMPLIRRALDSRPHSPDAQLALAECLSGAGNFREARSYAESAAKSMPDSVEAHSTLAAVYAGLHRPADAATERRTAVSLANAGDPGPKLDALAPDFELQDASHKSVALHDFRGKTPVVLVFGSYSCPNFRGSAAALTSLHQRYGSHIPFLLVYVREAHSTTQWQSTRNQRENITLPPAATLAEKQDHAAMCSRKLHLPFPALTDGMDGAVENAYNAWPSRLFVVGEDGRIRYSSRLTELDFHPQDLEAVLRNPGGLASR